MYIHRGEMPWLGIILHCRSSLYPFGGIIRSEDYVPSFPRTLGVYRSYEVDSPFLEWSQRNEWGLRLVVPE